MGSLGFRWLIQHRRRRGQAVVEFALIIPLFLLFIFGIFQTVMLYRTQLALNQAASDAVHVVVAQSSDGDKTAGGTYATADAPALGAIRPALATLNLNSLSGQCLDGSAAPCTGGSRASGVDISSDDGSGNAKTWPVKLSEDLTAILAVPETVRLDNHYVYAPSAVQCPVDQFSLTNGLDNPPEPPHTWLACSLPWNGRAFDPSLTTGNQNGRHDQRCDEDTVQVKIRYNYVSIAFPVHWGLQLVGTASGTLEPRQYLGNSAAVQATSGSCS